MFSLAYLREITSGAQARAYHWVALYKQLLKQFSKARQAKHWICLAWFGRLLPFIFCSFGCISLHFHFMSFIFFNGIFADGTLVIETLGIAESAAFFWDLGCGRRWVPQNPNNPPRASAKLNSRCRWIPTGAF